jgi:predicted phosphodiesterase
MLAIVVTLATTLRGSATSGSGTSDAPWLFLSDIHFDRIYNQNAPPNYYKDDTDPALLTSFLAAAKRVNPNPPVVVIAGDFIAHHARDRDAASTFAMLASRLNETFPKAQFLFTLGNEDSSCGDYTPTQGSAFLKAVAKAWAPLVDRNGAAPTFAATFARDGSYVARLPVAGLRAVVFDDNFLSVRYDDKCAGSAAASAVFDDLTADLRATPAKTNNWLLFHEPPGIDSYSTGYLTHGLFVVPFLRPHSRDNLLRAIADPRAHVILAIAGHTHRFGFRIVPTAAGAGIPLLVVPSISPVFNNHPSFLVVPVARDGMLGNIRQFAFDGAHWSELGDLASLGVARFDASALRRLDGTLLAGTADRARFAHLYEGGAPSEIGPKLWPVYACAMTEFDDAAFERCAGRSGFSILTRRGVVIVTFVIVLALAFAAVLRRLSIAVRRRAENR